MNIVFPGVGSLHVVVWPDGAMWLPLLLHAYGLVLVSSQKACDFVPPNDFSGGKAIPKVKCLSQKRWTADAASSMAMRYAPILYFHPMEQYGLTGISSTMQLDDIPLDNSQFHSCKQQPITRECMYFGIMADIPRLSRPITIEPLLLHFCVSSGVLTSYNVKLDCTFLELSTHGSSKCNMAS